MSGQQIQVSREIAGSTLTITTGEIAKQASGAVLVQYGETTVLVASVAGGGREGLDFFPLTVDYRERYAAVGRFPGGFLKREGRPSNNEILTARLTDRPIRPLFPDGYHEEVQIQSTVMACDGENLPDVQSIIGASAALSLAPVPFKGPIGAVRIGQIDGELVVFPTHQQLEESDLDLVVAGTKESVLMIEGFGAEIPEDTMVGAIVKAHEVIGEICDLIEELKQAAGVQPVEHPEPEVNPFIEMIREEVTPPMRDAKQVAAKQERSDATKAIKDSLIEKYFPEGATETEAGLTIDQLKEAIYKYEKQVVRQLILEEKRIDGRKPGDLRAVTCRSSVLPRVHGSALFTRGETQSLATLTLGTARDRQRQEDLFGEREKPFMLDYNFPSYSVGECRPIRGPGRREIGHGMLAERSVERVLPSQDKFPYTIRVISDITESNGSSSMASVCNATLALMDAGVPIVQPVAGISIGLVKEDNGYTLLTDIMGDEDHFGDMDFKVAGTQRGITGIQLDLKIDGINEEIIRATLQQARDARINLLRTMLTEIRRPRAEISAFAPRLEQLKIDPEKIGALIGPGGKNIRALQEQTGTTIDIVDDGTVTIAGPSLEAVNGAISRVEAITEDVKVGRVYKGKVSAVRDFGAFVEIAPGKDGLCHISELADGFVKSVNDICKVGDVLEVKVIAVDDQNRVKLSRKAVLADAKGDEEGGDEEFDEDDE